MALNNLMHALTHMVPVRQRPCDLTRPHYWMHASQSDSTAVIPVHYLYKYHPFTKTNNWCHVGMPRCS